MLYQLGSSVGARIGRKACGFSDNWVTAFHSLADYFFDAGWGRIQIDDKDFSQAMLDGALVVVRENFFVQGRHSTAAPSCYFLAGVFAGVASELLSEQYRCIELKCVAAGSSECRFGLVKQQDVQS